MKHGCLIFSICFALLHQFSFAQAVPVQIVRTNDGNWQLMRGGQPYYIQGVGGHTQLEKAVSIGANSIRTWSTDDAGAILDAAHAHGLTVMMGLWVQHERHGFDYNDTAKVRAQLNYFTEMVQQYKDHPALLMWGVGNEVDLFYTNTRVWYAVNDIAEMIHRIDPNHPTITVTAGLDPEEVRLIKERAPAIDIYGVNTYGDIDRVRGNILKYGWSGPYIITEWGPNGHWEVAKTQWDAPVEQSSTEKANSYDQRYRSAIAGDPAQCIGSYVFLWGFKQETTSTWYGLFSDHGASSEAVDKLHLLWKGTAPKNSAPILDSAFLAQEIKGANILLSANMRVEAQAFLRDPDGDRLRYVWEVVPESQDIRAGGDAESRPPALNNVYGLKKGNRFSFRTPATEGAYRLFMYAFDGKGHYAYTNIPFYVQPQNGQGAEQPFIQFKKQSLEHADEK